MGGNRRRKSARDKKAWQPNEIDHLRYDKPKNKRPDEWGRYSEPEVKDDRPRGDVQ